MNDETLMLDEDETLALLRAGRTGTEPPLVDLTDIAIAGGRRMRAHRWTARAGGALVLAGAASLAVATAMPDMSAARQPVVQPADRGGTEGGTSAVVTEVEAEVINRQVLADALGPDFRIHLSQGTPRFASIELVPGSRTAKLLPAGFESATEVEVSSGFTQLAEPCNPADKLARSEVCAHRPLPGEGGEVLHSVSRSADKNYFAASSNAYYHRPDGKLARATVTARPVDKNMMVDDATRTAVVSWLRSLDDALATAVSDPRMAAANAAPAPQTSTARYQDDRNNDYLLETFGQDWVRLGTGFQAEDGSTAASGLPAGYRGRVLLWVAENSETAAEFCRHPLPAQGTCAVREAPGLGEQVAVQVEPVRYFSEDKASAAFRVIYVQPTTGDAVTAEVNVFGQGVSASESAREQVMTWLVGFEDELIRAATDSRMAEDTENRLAEDTPQG